MSVRRFLDSESAVDYLYGYLDPGVGVSIDSRMVRAGQLFFGLRGEHVDGGVYAGAALRGGALLAVVEVGSDWAVGVEVGERDRVVEVEDVLVVLRGLAYRHRSFLDCPVLAVTGSNGKTTTVRLIQRSLGSTYRAYGTIGNYNNDIGVPVSLLSCGRDAEFVVLELGANHCGEIGSLCELVRPTHGLITSIGRAHLSGFGSVEGVRSAKGELFAWLVKHGGLSFVRDDDANTKWLGDHYHTGCFSSHYSLESYGAVVEEGESGVRVTVRVGGRSYCIETHLCGAYNGINVVAAFHVSHYFNVDGDRICEALLGYSSPDARSRVERRGGNRVVVDCYNANPTSMLAALDSFGRGGGGGVLILGEMFELGSISLELHGEVLDRAVGLGAERVYLVGGGWPMMERAGVEYYADVEGLIEHLRGFPVAHRRVLVKGSRAVGLERVLDALGEVQAND